MNNNHREYFNLMMESEQRLFIYFKGLLIIEIMFAEVRNGFQ